MTTESNFSHCWMTNLEMYHLLFSYLWVLVSLLASNRIAGGGRGGGGGGGTTGDLASKELLLFSFEPGELGIDAVAMMGILGTWFSIKKKKHIEYRLTSHRS